MIKDWWWGYKHVNGGLHLKPYTGMKEIRTAEDSPFIDMVFGPFEAETKDEASLLLYQKSVQWGTK